MSMNTNLFIYINQHLHNPILDMIMPILTHFGGFIWLFVILLVIIIYSKWANRQTLKRIAIIALIALLLSDLIAVFLKNYVHEPRPFMTLDNVNLLIVENDPNSFPSGHVTSTLAIVSVFLINMEKLIKKYYWIADIILVVFSVSVMFSRIYCGVHYPFDVFAGAIIGIFSALTIDHFKDSILSITERFF